jgi:hypothetical protein
MVLEKWVGFFLANLLGFYWGLYVDREKKLAAVLAFGEKNLE